jgi:hypothetical protein
MQTKPSNSLKPSNSSKEGNFLVTIKSQDFDALRLGSGKMPFQKDWDLPRKETLKYYTNMSGEGAAEEAFKILNAPDEFLLANEKSKKGDFKGHSLSVGDVVEVENIETKKVTPFLCSPIGWEVGETYISKSKDKSKENHSPSMDI